ncbi:MAG: glutamine-hydrolyzing carbamoyl-phosphate synthase small subunit [Raineya sp.]|nr:glutamine-hydrolyzing carbamoyl-phosphate synthase small subunit [Raineya sp.]MDW8297309.1 glutamine-hydrolyzing carbamoyl-phosphate synthase small subunit [Raineya sp.]
MKYNFLPPARLLLEDNTLFEGFGIGKIGTTSGEICFNTGMTGYQEIYTDPSYFGQIVVNTTPHVGIYGIHPQEQESEKPTIRGMVCNAFSQIYSRHSAVSSLQNYLETNNIVAIAGVDTRRLVQHIRTQGAMNGVISSENLDIDFLKARLQETPPMKGLELSSQVSTKRSYFWGNPQAKYKVAVLDLGVKRSILRCLAERNMYLQVFPAQTSFSEMQKFNPDGFFISNGPGDPAAMPYAVETVRQILENNAPLFGICLGHQILALASGVGTHKMHHGHRGLNHPVKNLLTGKSEITSQNHGFGVNREEIEQNPHIQITHINLNDNSVEGLRRTDKPAFSVQYHPEASPGTHDSRYLFDEFTQLLERASYTQWKEVLDLRT